MWKRNMSLDNREQIAKHPHPLTTFSCPSIAKQVPAHVERSCPTQVIGDQQYPKSGKPGLRGCRSSEGLWIAGLLLTCTENIGCIIKYWKEFTYVQSTIRKCLAQRPNFWSRFVFIAAAPHMVAQQPQRLRGSAQRLKRVMKKTKQSIPFDTDTPLSLARPQSAREKHRNWIMSALRYLKAPLVFWMHRMQTI